MVPLVGCMDYNLGQFEDEKNLETTVEDTGNPYVPGNPTLPSDTGSEEDLDDTGYDGPIEEVQTCDPHGDGWIFNPDGYDRPGCFGIESVFEGAETTNGGVLCVGIYTKDCMDEFGELTWDYQDNSNETLFDYVSSIGIGGNSECGGRDEGFQTLCLYGNDTDFSGFNEKLNIYLLSGEEEEESYQQYGAFNDDQLRYIDDNNLRDIALELEIDCLEGTTTLDKCYAWMHP